MTINNHELLSHLNQLLKPEKIKDYCPNGLQIEGCSDVSKLVTGVTACQSLINRAIELEANAIFVHHGYFWRGENPCITGMKRRRIKDLITHDINLYGYHLPLDIHPQLGNNAQLAKRLNIEVVGGLELKNPQSIAMQGQFEIPLTLEQLSLNVASSLQRKPQVISGGEHPIKTIAWCTGGGQNYIEMAAEQGIDAFISGEISEQTVHTAREMGIHFIAAGHHATERYGAKAVGDHLAKSVDLDVTFVDIDNPV